MKKKKLLLLLFNATLEKKMGERLRSSSSDSTRPLLYRSLGGARCNTYIHTIRLLYYFRRSVQFSSVPFRQSR